MRRAAPRDSAGARVWAGELQKFEGKAGSRLISEDVDGSGRCVYLSSDGGPDVTSPNGSSADDPTNPARPPGTAPSAPSRSRCASIHRRATQHARARAEQQQQQQPRAESWSRGRYACLSPVPKPEALDVCPPCSALTDGALLYL